MRPTLDMASSAMAAAANTLDRHDAIPPESAPASDDSGEPSVMMEKIEPCRAADCQPAHAQPLQPHDVVYAASPRFSSSASGVGSRPRNSV